MSHRHPSLPAPITALALLVSVATFPACFAWAPKFEAATVSPERITVPPGTARGLPLKFEAPWVQEGQRWCVRGKDVRVAPMGLRLRNADVCMTAQPVSLRGTAEVVLPSGMAGALVPSLGGPGRARIDLATGEKLGKVATAQGAIALNRGNYYLRLSYDGTRQLGLGSVNVTTPGGSGMLLIDPAEGLFYATGSIDGLPGSRLGSVAVGLSPAGRLPFRAKRRLPRLGRLSMKSHVLVGGAVQLAQYPVTIEGLVAFDADRNRDRRTAFQDGNTRDLGIAANGQVNLSFSAAGLGLNLKLGDASVAVLGANASNHGLYFSGASSKGLFEGTPLAFIKPAARFDVSGYVRSPLDLALNATVRGRMFGLAASQVKLAVTGSGANVSGRVKLPLNMGQVQVSGRVGRRGVRLVGRGNVRLAGVPIAKARVELGHKGVHISGRASLFGASVAVAGRVQPNGKFSLKGKASVSVGWKKGIIPLHLSGSVGVGLTNRGPTAHLAGKVCFSGACVHLPGVSLDRHARACLDLRPLGKVCTPKLLR